MILYTDEFLENIPEEPRLGLHLICDTFLRTSQGALEIALEFYALAEAYIKANDLEIVMPKLSINRKEKADAIYQFAVRTCKDLERYVEINTDQLKLQEFRNKFSSRILGGFVYEFTDGDLSRIQKGLSELNELVSNSDKFQSQHKKRLLQRIIKLQKNLKKKLTDLDPFWGLIGDAGVVIGKLGASDAKPIVSQIKALSNIIWLTQARAEELSSDCKVPALFLTEAKN